MRLCSLYLALFSTLMLTACYDSPSSTSEEEKKADTYENKQPDQSKKTILFFGNSLTAGYGLDLDQSFPSLIQDKIDSLGLGYNVVNGGISGETTAGGLGRIDWMLRDKIDVFVLELGGNDGLRGINTKSTKQNLQDIIDKVKTKYPDCQIILAGMEAPPNLGKDFTTQFRNIFTDLAKQNNTALIPFLLEGVAGEQDLNLADGIHPNTEGQIIVTENIWRVLLPLIT